MDDNPRKKNDVPELLLKAADHQRQGNGNEAESLYLEIIATSPLQVSALYRLGVLYFQNGRPVEALPFLERALKIQPRNVAILNGLGIALHLSGRDNDAEARFHEALTIEPSNLDTLANLSKALREQKKIEAVLDCLSTIKHEFSRRPDLYLELGKCQFEKGDFQAAVSNFEKALTFKSDDIDALGLLSHALWALGRREEARLALERALEISPQDPKVVLNFGEFLAFDEGKIDEACDYFDRALALAPGYVNAMWRKSFALLAKGDYIDGWRLYAQCLGSRDTRGFNRFAPQEPWDGKKNLSTRLLIWCEQGLGDSLQFIRYATLCKERVGRVSVFCQKPLVCFFQGLPYIDEASDSVDRTSFDEHVPIMNLPNIFETTVDTVPGHPYLEVGSDLEEQWSKKFKDDDQFRVGLVWAGGSHEDNVVAMLADKQRSMTLDRMRPWFDVEGVTYYSLQKGEPALQINEFGLEAYVVDFMGEVADFADTAAIIKNLDLVITVDTAVAHMAGGLGKPVWILSRLNADWRWLQNQTESPWYPTARIFGQKNLGEWEAVIEEVRHNLRLEVERKYSH